MSRLSVARIRDEPTEWALTKNVFRPRIMNYIVGRRALAAKSQHSDLNGASRRSKRAGNRMLPIRQTASKA